MSERFDSAGNCRMHICYNRQMVTMANLKCFNAIIHLILPCSEGHNALWSGAALFVLRNQLWEYCMLTWLHQSREVLRDAFQYLSWKWVRIRLLTSAFTSVFNMVYTCYEQVNHAQQSLPRYTLIIGCKPIYWVMQSVTFTINSKIHKSDFLLY